MNSPVRTGCRQDVARTTGQRGCRSRPAETLNKTDERELIEKVAERLNAVQQMRDAPDGFGARAPHHADDTASGIQKKLADMTCPAGNAGDEGRPGWLVQSAVSLLASVGKSASNR